MPKKTKSASIKEFSQKIETFLMKHKNQSYSELQIAEQIFGAKASKASNLPISQEQLKTLSSIRDALKLLLQDSKIVGSLIEDPITGEQVMHYSVTGWYATP